MYCKGFKGVFDHFGTDERSIRTHAHNILVIIIVRDTVHIHRVTQHLVFGHITHCRILHTLYTEVQPQYTLIDKRRQAFIQCRIQQEVQLALCQHRQFGYRYFQLIHFQGYIIAVEVTPMINILCTVIHYRVIIYRVQLLFDNLRGILDRIVDRTQDLRHTA
ncbi:hypothetical protein D9M68_863520 [compost metagenome]